ncbi:MAG TPA: MarR family transcriptional regulator [Dermatophilaceae bacterium]|nr:MarR family transcriptional regulator [Dermatophilaceae bacterium]
MSSPLPQLDPELDPDAADRASERDPVPGPEPRWLSDEEQRHWRSYLRGSRLLEVALDHDLQSQGVQLSEYELISMLSEAPGGRLRMSVLAELIVQSRSRVTHTAARLERRGWVRREACLEDRRGVELVLTDAGRAAVERMARVHVESVRRHLLDAMPPEQFAQLGQAMQRIRQQVADEGEITGGMAD